MNGSMQYYMQMRVGTICAKYIPNAKRLQGCMAMTNASASREYDLIHQSRFEILTAVSLEDSSSPPSPA